MYVIYWPCGTWCYKEELWEYTHMSDDHTKIEIPDDCTEDIDDIVTNCLMHESINREETHA